MTKRIEITPAIAVAIEREAAAWAKHFRVEEPEAIEGRRRVMRANLAVGYIEPLLPFIATEG